MGRLIQKRTQAGLLAARARGRKGGRPPVDGTKIQSAPFFTRIQARGQFIEMFICIKLQVQISI